jgi:hypothetical protein
MLRNCTLCFIDIAVYKALKPNMHKHYSFLNLPYHPFLSHNKISNHMQYNFSPSVCPNRETLKYRQTIHEINEKMPNLIFFPKSNFLVIQITISITISNDKYHYNIYIYIFSCFQKSPIFKQGTGCMEYETNNY